MREFSKYIWMITHKNSWTYEEILIQILCVWNLKFSDRLSEIFWSYEKFSDSIMYKLVTVKRNPYKCWWGKQKFSDAIRKFLIALGFVIPFLIKIMFPNTFMTYRQLKISVYWNLRILQRLICFLAGHWEQSTSTIASSLWSGKKCRIF